MNHSIFNLIFDTNFVYIDNTNLLVLLVTFPTSFVTKQAKNLIKTLQGERSPLVNITNEKQKKKKQKHYNNKVFISIITSSRTNFSPNDWWKWVTRLRQKGASLNKSKPSVSWRAKNIRQRTLFLLWLLEESSLNRTWARAIRPGS